MITIDKANTGWGITDSIMGTYRWNGHSFNPTSNPGDGSQTWDIWTYPDPAGTLSFYNQTNSFSLSGFQYGIEVVMAILEFTSDKADNGYAYMKFYDPDDNLVLDYSWYWSVPSGAQYRYYWIGMGVKYNGEEIWKDGSYRFNYRVTYDGGVSEVSGDVYFTISNYPTPTVPGTSHRGKLWVEGYKLAFVCYSNGVKILIPHDGTASYVGTEHSGKIWLESDGKVSYIDASGYKRYTKLGDRYGYGGWSSEIPGSPGSSYQGHIWVCSDDNATYLVIISSNGVKYRIGAGSTIGDYQ